MILLKTPYSRHSQSLGKPNTSDILGNRFNIDILSNNSISLFPIIYSVASTISLSDIRFNNSVIYVNPY